MLYNFLYIHFTLEVNKVVCVLGASCAAGASSPEQSLEVFRELGPAGVAWVHGDEDADGGAETHLLPHEVKPLFLISNGVLDALDLQMQKTSVISSCSHQPKCFCTTL